MSNFGVEPPRTSRRPICFHLVGVPSIAGGGGSNTFVRGLIARQLSLGWEPILLTHSREGHCGSASVSEDAEFGVNVRVLPPVRGTSRKAYFSRRPASAPGVIELFTELKPCVVHFHTLGLTAGLPHLEAAKAINARTIVTYHTGGISCPQTGLLENGISPCDGRLEIVRCTRCRFASRGMHPLLAGILARLPTVSHFDNAEGLSGRLLSSRSMTQTFMNSFRSAVDLVDVFHIQSRWIRDVLALNGVDDNKIVFVEMGVSQAPIQVEYDAPEVFSEKRPLRLVFAGRCSDVKGIETIFAALGYLGQNAPVEIALLGSGWDSEYGRRLWRPVEADKRVLIPRVVETAGILHELSKHDACLVPSLWLETGPLAVYEAMAAGLPIIGSRLGGVAERVRHGVDGVLFPAGDPQALAGIIAELISFPERLNNLRRHIRPQRTFDEMARELDLIYRA